jgi:signal transduction histidine kinase
MNDELQQRRERELNNLRADNERLRRRLVMLSRLGERIASSLEVDRVFQEVIDSACELTGARYGALGVFGASGRVEKFVTHGLSEEERERIGALPEGLGIVGWLRDLQEPLRLGDLTKHPRAVGFPPNHPAMKTFLGAPVRHRNDTLGNIYLTEKANAEDFTPEDENLLVLFAAQAAMAIRNAQLHRKVQDLVVLEERDRIGMDLHDGVIQSLYATGLRLETCLEDVGVQTPEVKLELSKAIDQLNQVIADVRSYIFQLRPGMLADADLAGAIGGLLQELKVNTLMDVELEEEPGACQGLSDFQTNALFLVGQEALTNARKHAQASRVSAQLQQRDGAFTMRIRDDGNGFAASNPGRGQGLRNMRERIEKMGGTLAVSSTPQHGTEVVVTVPVEKRAETDE